jgi:hypothetical protein
MTSHNPIVSFGIMLACAAAVAAALSWQAFVGFVVGRRRRYLALLEQKPGALDQAVPLQNWALPEPLQHLRRLLEGRMGNRGKREFIQALRLVEVFPETLVAAAALDAIRLCAISFDAVNSSSPRSNTDPQSSISATIPICPPPMSGRPQPPIIWLSFPGAPRDDGGSALRYLVVINCCNDIIPIL